MCAFTLIKGCCLRTPVMSAVSECRTKKIKIKIRKRKLWQSAEDDELDENQYELKELEKLEKQKKTKLEDEEELEVVRKLKDVLVEGTGARGVYFSARIC